MSDNIHTLDARGLNCPLPILRTRKTLAGLQTGDVLEIMATDPGSVKDLGAFCSQTGNQILSHRQWVGAASFLPRALTADVNLFV